MTLQTPGHALRLGMIHHRHVVDGTVAAKTTDTPVDVRAVIVKNVVGRAMNLHPLDRVACFPARAHRLELWIIFLHLGGSSCTSGYWAGSSGPPSRQSYGSNGNPFPVVTRAGHAKTAAPAESAHTHPGVFGRYVIPRAGGQSTDGRRCRKPQFLAAASSSSVEKICHEF